MKKMSHRREAAAADAVSDWKDRHASPRSLSAAAADKTRRSRIDDLAALFAETTGGASTTRVFEEMTRTLADQGVDEAIAYVQTHQGSIRRPVRSRVAAARTRNRDDLLPLLETAALYVMKGQRADARSLDEDILDAEPDWGEALHAAFWFFVDGGHGA